MPDQTIMFIGTAILAVALIPLVLFILIYRTMPWRADPLGISLMIQKVNLGVVIIIILAGNLLPPEFDVLRYWLRFAAFVGVVISLWIDVENLRRIKTHSPRPLFFQRFTRKYPRA